MSTRTVSSASAQHKLSCVAEEEEAREGQRSAQSRIGIPRGAVGAIGRPTDQLDVTMHDAIPVAVVKCPAQLQEGSARLDLPNRAVGLQRAPHRIAQRAPSADGEDHCDGRGVLDGAVERADVGVAEGFVDGDLVAYPLKLLRVQGALAHHFGRNRRAIRPEAAEPDRRGGALAEHLAGNLEAHRGRHEARHGCGGADGCCAGGNHRMGGAGRQPTVERACQSVSIPIGCHEGSRTLVCG